VCHSTLFFTPATEEVARLLNRGQHWKFFDQNPPNDPFPLVPSDQDREQLLKEKLPFSDQELLLMANLFNALSMWNATDGPQEVAFVKTSATDQVAFAQSKQHQVNDTNHFATHESVFVQL